MKYLLVVTGIALALSCGRRHYFNEAGAVRPMKKNIFRYKNRFRGLPDKIDTNAAYVRHWDYMNYSGGRTDVYEFYRFFRNGQVWYSGADTVLNLNKGNNLSRGMIGYYYHKRGQLRMQVFGAVAGGAFGIRRTYGYIKNGNIYTYIVTPETYYGSYRLTKAFSNQHREWKKHQMPAPVNQNAHW